MPVVSYYVKTSVIACNAVLRWYVSNKKKIKKFHARSTINTLGKVSKYDLENVYNLQVMCAVSLIGDYSLRITKITERGRMVP